MKSELFDQLHSTLLSLHIKVQAARVELDEVHVVATPELIGPCVRTVTSDVQTALALAQLLEEEVGRLLAAVID